MGARAIHACGLQLHQRGARGWSARVPGVGLWSVARQNTGAERRTASERRRVHRASICSNSRCAGARRQIECRAGAFPALLCDGGRRWACLGRIKNSKPGRGQLINGCCRQGPRCVLQISCATYGGVEAARAIEGAGRTEVIAVVEGAAQWGARGTGARTRCVATARSGGGETRGTAARAARATEGRRTPGAAPGKGRWL